MSAPVFPVTTSSGKQGNNYFRKAVISYDSIFSVIKTKDDATFNPITTTSKTVEAAISHIVNSKKVRKYNPKPFECSNILPPLYNSDNGFTTTQIPIRFTDLDSPEPDKINNRCGYLSPRSVAKIRNKIKAFFDANYYKNAGFFTVSVPVSNDEITDKDIQKHFNILLTRLRKQYKGLQYLWVAERQKRSTLHYHIIFDRYVDVTLANYMWCKCLDNSGFNLLNKLPTFKKSGKSYIIDSTGAANPVHYQPINNSTRLSSYMTKEIGLSNYFIKQSKDTDTGLAPINGSIWYCSRMFSALATKLHVNIHEDEYQSILNDQQYINKDGKHVIIQEKAIENDKTIIGYTFKVVNTDRLNYAFKYLSTFNYHIVNAYRYHNDKDAIKNYLKNKLQSVYDSVPIFYSHLNYTEKNNRLKFRFRQSEYKFENSIPVSDTSHLITS